jgi:hypothetical protein
MTRQPEVSLTSNSTHTHSTSAACPQKGQAAFYFEQEEESGGGNKILEFERGGGVSSGGELSMSSTGAAVGVEKDEQVSLPTPSPRVAYIPFPTERKGRAPAYAAILILPENGTMMPSR